MEKLVNFRSTFEGKKVFLTGHTGFKGAWLTLMLHDLGAEVIGFALAPKTEHDLYNAIHGDALCQSIIGDIRDAKLVADAMGEAQPDFVFHMAAQALVLDSYTHPLETYATNVMGTAHVLDALKRINKPCTSVIITTDKVYENYETKDPYPETARLGGYDPYSNSKACAELVTSAYRNSFFNPSTYDQHRQRIATARSGNVIGGGDWSANRLVPDIARALMANEPIEIRNPQSVRPWQHVLDPLVGYLTLASAMATGISVSEAFNFGPDPNDERTVKDMCELAIETWGAGEYSTPTQTHKPHEAGLLKLDNSLANKELGWSPMFDSATAMRITMEWYKSAGEHALAFTRKQIDELLPT